MIGQYTTDQSGDPHSKTRIFVPLHFFFFCFYVSYTVPESNVFSFNCFSLLGSKRISFEEFLPIFLSFGQRKPTQSSNEGFVDGLRVFDRDGSGQISAAELRHVLTGLGWIPCFLS